MTARVLVLLLALALSGCELMQRKAPEAAKACEVVVLIPPAADLLETPVPPKPRLPYDNKALITWAGASHDAVKACNEGKADTRAWIEDNTPKPAAAPATGPHR